MNTEQEKRLVGSDRVMLIDAVLNLMRQYEFPKDVMQEAENELWKQGEDTEVILKHIEQMLPGYKSPFGFKEVSEEFYRIQRERRRQIIEQHVPENLLLILQHPKLFTEITKKELDKKIVAEIETRQTIFLCACGRLVENADKTSYNLLVNSESGAGKDHITSKTLDIIPKELYEKRTRISATAFTYWKDAKKHPNHTWDGKICYLEDVSEEVLNSDVFKVMCSSGSRATITKNQEAVEIEIRGKPVLLLTTAEAAPKSEMLRRLPIVKCNESQDQTKEIIKRQAELAVKGIAPVYDQEFIDAQKHLRRVKVRVTFAELLDKHFPSEHLVIRTHFQRFLDYIKASTALHQFQRKNDSEGFILAEKQDYEIASIALIKTTSNSSMIPMTQSQEKTLELIKSLPRTEIKDTELGEKEVPVWYSIRDLEAKINFISLRQINYAVTHLVKYGLLAKDKEKRENSKKPSMVYRYLDQTEIKIPSWEDVTASLTS